MVFSQVKVFLMKSKMLGMSLIRESERVREREREAQTVSVVSQQAIFSI